MKNIFIISILAIAAIVVAVFLFRDTHVPAEPNFAEPTESGLPAQPGLPPAVEAKRQALYAASQARDYEQLDALTGPNFHYSFGGAYESGFIGYLKLSESDSGKSAFDIIPTLLAQPYSVRDDLYTWPSVFSLTAEQWTQSDIDQMKTFLTETQIESYRQFGAYIYYRLGITATGDWVFYLAGD